MIDSEPIFALSSAPARSAVHLHRLSGSGIFARLEPFLIHPRTGKRLSPQQWLPTDTRPRSRYVRLVGRDGFPLDDVLLTAFRGPWSYTGEDVVEIGSHGSPLLTAKLQSLLRQAGLRDARPGEFTQRAFLRGKLDLAQAEAVHATIEATSTGALRLAQDALSGRISQHVDTLRSEFLAILAPLEAAIDFDESEVGTLPTRLLMEQGTALARRLKALASSWSQGRVIRDGARTVLTGKPNAGKSTLFNALLREERAIVTPIAGTTRDVLRDHLLLEGREFVLHDTAGLRESCDAVESAGIRRAEQSALEADIVCHVHDVRHPLPDVRMLHPAPPRQCLLVLTMCDLATPEEVHAKASEATQNGIACATTSPENIASLETLLVAAHVQLTVGAPSGSPTLISTRQCDAAQMAAQQVERAVDELRREIWPEKVASTLNGALEHLNEIIGKVTPDDVLHRVFGEFCIGK